jgi:ribosomal protein S27E
MAIEMGCTGCGQTLRVADEHAGKKARCPACGTIVQIPSPGDAATLQPEFDKPPADAPVPTPEFNPFADLPEVNVGRSVSPMSPPSSPFFATKPHRGGLILTLGILGIVLSMPGLCCPLLALGSLPCGISAWIMGASDLAEIRAGRMDFNGRGMTSAGVTLGIVGTVLGVLTVAGSVAWIAVNAL